MQVADDDGRIASAVRRFGEKSQTAVNTPEDVERVRALLAPEKGRVA